MSTFATFNQFDKRFDDLTKFSQDRSVCGIFSIITCYNFMINNLTSKKQHEQNIYTAIMNYCIQQLPKYMTFEELVILLTSGLNPKSISATTPELIKTGILSYDHIFKFDTQDKYCVIFLKNRNYYTILCDNSVYHLRDSHENTQYTFTNFESLRIHLDIVYQFEQETVVDSIKIPEFSNIEYIVIDTPFQPKNMDPELFDHSLFEDEPEDNQKDKQENNQKEDKEINQKQCIIHEVSDFYLPNTMKGYDCIILSENQESDDYVNFDL
ncbi:MAG: hypothetical protein Barrevirus3_21 [Barrevirus sp.]|uniref:Uncharacterized protein n=1 Tax=Barrevirus sp. TaxID=2487763 RepID=A0A3G4ZSA9_9VIRU|nr:MAG: hypothetical protein Barrevirus3_21 [Barrevirus sp.]